MATLTVTELDRAGKDLAATAVAADVAGDKWANTGAEWIYVFNNSGITVTVTLDILKTTDGQAVTDKTVAIAAGKHFQIGPFPAVFYNDAQGRATVKYSAVTSVTVAVFSLP